MLNKRKISNIFERFQKNNLHPTTELQYTSDFELLVAVILSAQATDIAVNKITAKLFPMANTPASIIELRLVRLENTIRSIGLFRNKAKNILATCEKLLADHAGTVPTSRAALETLPGVGRKTANVILNTLYGMPVIAVDTHIFRLAKRIGLSRGKTVRQVEDDLTKKIPACFKKNAHHWLILHGRYVCKARKPLCSTCLIQDLCEYNLKQAN